VLCLPCNHYQLHVTIQLYLDRQLCRSKGRDYLFFSSTFQPSYIKYKCFPVYLFLFFLLFVMKITKENYV
jgi:hypothetical protein